MCLRSSTVPSTVTELIAFGNGEFTLFMSSDSLLKCFPESPEGTFLRNYEEYSKYYDCEIIGNVYQDPELHT